MEKSPTRLGRGLSALIPPQAPRLLPAETPAAPASPSSSEGVQELSLSAIVTNPSQPRTVFTKEALADLTASVKLHGVLQPVMVRPRGGGRYELVAGERRYRAAQAAGLTRIPAVIRSLTDEESLTVALIENIQREDLNPIEAARAYRQLMDEYGLTQTQLGAQIGKNQSTISNTMRLLTLPDEMQDSISDGRISAEHGKTLLGIKDAKKRLKLWHSMVTERISRDDARSRAGKRISPQGDTALNPNMQEIVERLRRIVRTKLDFKPGQTGGATITINCASDEELEGLLDRIGA